VGARRIGGRAARRGVGTEVLRAGFVAATVLFAGVFAALGYRRSATSRPRPLPELAMMLCPVDPMN